MTLSHQPSDLASAASDFADFSRARDENRLFISEYPYDLKSRAYEKTLGGQKIAKMLARDSDNALNWLAAIQTFLPALQKIPLEPTGDEPGWVNGMLPALDGMLMYAMVRTLKPKTYLEVGSGNSTKFVRRAIRDGDLSTKLISIDPYPRADIDRLCDEVIRTPFENVPETLYQSLVQHNDMVFIDNSHRSFANSDVTVFFTETLPALPSGVYYGIHDICLPMDYSSELAGRFYNEQYLLASYLLGGADGDQIEFPGTYVGLEMTFNPALHSIFSLAEFAGALAYSGGFWLKRGEV
jgi:hypothetical protein